MNESYHPIVVNTGEIMDSNNPSSFISFGFSFCSAVVLDYDIGTLFAHAFPNTNGYQSPPNDTSADNVVNRLVKRLELKRIPIKNAKGYVNADSEKALEQISQELADVGVKIRVANMDFAPPSWSGGIWKPTRNITYDSRSKILSIKPIKNIPNPTMPYNFDISKHELYYDCRLIK